MANGRAETTCLHPRDQARCARRVIRVQDPARLSWNRADIE